MNRGQKQNKKINVVNPVVSGLTGAAIGMGIAGTAIVLNGKKNRDKVKKVLINTKNQVVNYIDEMNSHAKKKKNEVLEKIEKELVNAKKEEKLEESSLN